MAAQPVPLSVEEFHRLYDGAKPAYEYWFGQAIQKPMPTNVHGLIQFILATLLKKAGWNPNVEIRLKVIREAEPVPDLIAVRGKYKGSYPRQAPELCVEILSPGDRLRRALEKAKYYLSWGSECVWIIDPEQRTAWICSRESPEPVWIAPDEVLKFAETEIPLNAVFEEVDRSLERE
jgi:Uma2 family endonuclease